MPIMPDIKLEVGKSYLTPTHPPVKVTIVDRLRCPTYPFLGDNGNTYTEEGRVLYSKLHTGDLVEEVLE